MIVAIDGPAGTGNSTIASILANKLNISEVKISGNKEYAAPLIEEIKTTYSLTYGNNNINVEVI